MAWDAAAEGEAVSLEQMVLETDRIYREVWEKRISVEAGREQLAALAKACWPFTPVRDPWFEGKLDLR